MKISKLLNLGIVMCLGFFMLLSTEGHSQEKVNPYHSLIPKAQYSFTDGAESFTLNSQTTVYCCDGDLALYVVEHLKNILGTTPGYKVFNSKKQIARELKNAQNYILISTADYKLGKFSKRDGKSARSHPEGYELNVNGNGITILGKDYGGVFNGIQTLFQLLPPQVYNSENKSFTDNTSIPSGKIIDWPEFGYRGFMLDVSRTWRPIEEVYKVIDWLAYHKLNKFHWHLTDDQGWRIEVKSLPKLNEIGSWRGPGERVQAVFGSGNKRYGGYYTHQQMKDLVAYAARRNIEVIPEIEMPGHSRSIAASYDIGCKRPSGDKLEWAEYSREIWCVAKESNYELLDTLFKEVSTIFPSAILNIGGDEVNHKNWEQCPDCQALMKKEGLNDMAELHNFFVQRVDKIAQKYGRTLAGWEELMAAGNLNPATQVYIWHNKNQARTAVEGKHPFVMQVAEYAYVDMKQSELERGHTWAGLVPLEKIYSYNPKSIATPVDNGKSEKENKAQVNKYLRGIQAGLWEELGNRPDNFVEYQMFPRVCALAEVAWGTAREFGEDQSANYADFWNRITQSHYPRMSNMHIRYRVQYPKVIAVDAITARKDVIMQDFERDGRKLYEISAEAPYEGAVIKYAIVAPETATNAIRGQADTTNYKYTYTKPIRTKNIADYRFATFATDTLHSLGVAVENEPLYKLIDYSNNVDTVKTNLKISKQGITPFIDNDPKTLIYFLGRAQKGDYIELIFKEPIQCSVIDVVSARPNIDFYGIVDGELEYSLDGVNYIKAEDFLESRAVARPAGAAVKSIRINITGETDGPNLYIADPKIY